MVSSLLSPERATRNLEIVSVEGTINLPSSEQSENLYVYLIIPQKKISSDPNYFEFYLNSTSLVGFHQYRQSEAIEGIAKCEYYAIFIQRDNSSYNADQSGYHIQKVKVCYLKLHESYISASNKCQNNFLLHYVIYHRKQLKHILNAINTYRYCLNKHRKSILLI